MTRARKIWHVDAFTATPLVGNPAAVMDGDGLLPETMQLIALNQRLSETVFLLPPEDAAHAAHIRIFTPTTELPFAGHPTIAAAHILATEMGVAPGGGRLLLETGAGVIPVEINVGGDGEHRYTMTQVAPQFRESDFDVAAIASMVGLEPADVVRAERVSTGMWWLVAEVASLEAMMRVQPDALALNRVPHGLAVFCVGATSKDANVHVRCFAPAAGIAEDPVTGSANGCIAVFIAKHGLVPEREGRTEYVAEQGLEMGQPGRVFASVTMDGEAMAVRIGGQAVTVLAGLLTLPR